jgi:hypothetical protein
MGLLLGALQVTAAFIATPAEGAIDLAMHPFIRDVG